MSFPQILPLNIKNYQPGGWTDWLTNFKIHTRASPNELSDEKKVALLMSKLGDDVFTIFKSFNVDIDSVSFDKLVTLFTDYFHPVKTRHVFLTTRQNSDETFEEFLHKLTVLSYPCRFGPFQESLVRDIFVKNMDNKYSYIRERILSMSDPSLKEASELANLLLYQDCGVSRLDESFSSLHINQGLPSNSSMQTIGLSESFLKDVPKTDLRGFNRSQSNFNCDSPVINSRRQQQYKGHQSESCLNKKSRSIKNEPLLKTFAVKPVSTGDIEEVEIHCINSNQLYVSPVSWEGIRYEFNNSLNNELNRDRQNKKPVESKKYCALWGGNWYRVDVLSINSETEEAFVSSLDFGWKKNLKFSAFCSTPLDFMVVQPLVLVVSTTDILPSNLREKQRLFLKFLTKYQNKPWSVSLVQPSKNETVQDETNLSEHQGNLGSSYNGIGSRHSNRGNDNPFPKQSRFDNAGKNNHRTHDKQYSSNSDLENSNLTYETSSHRNYRNGRGTSNNDNREHCEKNRKKAPFSQNGDSFRGAAIKNSQDNLNPFEKNNGRFKNSRHSGGGGNQSIGNKEERNELISHRSRQSIRQSNPTNLNANDVPQSRCVDNISSSLIPTDRFTLVKVIYVSNRGDVFICPKDRCNQLMEICEKLQRIYSDPDNKKILSEPKRKDKCSAPFEGAWYRAEILSINNEQKMAKILFYDFGNEEIVEFSKLMVLPPSLQEPGLSLPIKAPRLLKESDEVEIKPVGQEGNILIVELKEMMGKDECRASSKSSIPQKNTKERQTTNTNHKSGSPNQNNTNLRSPHPPPIPKNTFTAVRVVYHGTEGIFVTPTDRLLDLKSLIESVSSGSNHSLCQNPLLHNVYIAPYDGDLYRAKVIEIDREKGSARVIFIDFGNESEIKMNQLFDIPSNITEDCYTFKIRLDPESEKLVEEGADIKVSPVTHEPDGSWLVQVEEEPIGVDYQLPEPDEVRDDSGVRFTSNSGKARTNNQR